MIDKKKLISFLKFWASLIGFISGIGLVTTSMALLVKYNIVLGVLYTVIGFLGLIAMNVSPFFKKS